MRASITRAALVVALAGEALGLGQSDDFLMWDREPKTAWGPSYPAYNLSVPVDHFHNDSMYEPHSDGMFDLRYWFDASHYKEGGPVIVLAAGESDGEGRLHFMQKGILAKLAEATGGMAVVLEHRYYGASFPTPDLSTKNMRFLTTDQALADTAYFARNVVFKGFENVNLTSHTTPYIAYGGSYAGAFVAFLRKLYPDVFYGAISSSGVTAAIWDYWEYYEAARLFAPPECVVTTQKLIAVADNILLHNKTATDKLKHTFGLGELTHLADVAKVLSNHGLRAWQHLNWDPALSTTAVGTYCDAITSDRPVYEGLKDLTSTVHELLEAGGYPGHKDQLTTPMLNWIGALNATHVAPCRAQGRTQDDCFSMLNATRFADRALSRYDDLSWLYQVCTQWGYLLTGSGAPPTQLPLVSRLIDLEYLSFPCREAFDITEPADVGAINRYGGLNFSYPRVALIDGEADPWLYAGAHAPRAPQGRKSTVSEPFILIKGRAVHHWDENGLLPNETTADMPPREVVEVQRQEVEFVRAWMKEWRATHRGEDVANGFEIELR